VEVSGNYGLICEILPAVVAKLELVRKAIQEVFGNLAVPVDNK